MSTQNQAPKEVRVLEVTSPARDLLFYERVEAGKYRDGKPLPAMGTAHPVPSRWPTHELCGITPDDEEGWMRIYYAATRAAQEAYNWEHAEMWGNEYPRVRQTWVLKRSAYVPGAIAAPPSLGDRTWTYIGEEQQRTDPRTDGLFVIVIHEYQDISTTRVDEVVDLETGELRTVTRRVVARGSHGAGVDSDGVFSEVQAVNRLWSVETTRQLAGLAGAASKSRTYQKWDVWPWPGVLLYIFVGAIPAAGGGVAQYVWSPVWKRPRYRGSCLFTITEQWSKTPPTLTAEEQLIEDEIRFFGAMLRIEIEPCLHPLITIQEGTNTATDRFAPYLYSVQFPPTSPIDWPATLVARVDVIPSNSGYLKRTFLVNRPANTVAANAIFLSLGASGSSTQVLTWSSGIGSPSYRVDVCKNPNFSFDFVTGFQNLSVGSVTTKTVTGLEKGVPYFARVRNTSSAGGISNTVAFILPVGPELYMEDLTDEENPVTLARDGDLDFGDVAVGSSRSLPLRVTNTGEVPLVISEITFESLEETFPALYSHSLSTPLTLLAGEEVEFNLTFSPVDVANDIDVSMIITSDDPSGLFTLNLTGDGISEPELTIEVPPGTPATVLSPGTPPEYRVELPELSGAGTYTVRLINTGDGPLTIYDVFVFYSSGSSSRWVLTLPTDGMVMAVDEVFDIEIEYDGGGFAAGGVALATNDPLLNSAGSNGSITIYFSGDTAP